MNMPVKVEYFKNPKNRELTTFELDELARELDAIKQEVLDDIGEKDAQYIRRVYAAVRYAHLLQVVHVYLQVGSHLHGCWARAC
jgi:linoleoyl-CoA desaturase